MERIGVYAYTARRCGEGSRIRSNEIKEDAFCFGCQRLHEPIKKIWKTTKRR